MNSEKRHIEQWLMSGMLILLLILTACGSSSEDDVVTKPKEKPVLKIYLFAPESPIVTRADNGNVISYTQERQIHTIDVWVFEHNVPINRPHQVSYIHLDNLSFDGQREIAMEISDEFANLPQKPNVDIYVVANKESAGLNLNKNTTLDQLKTACIGTTFFGLSPLVTSESFPATGLPMSGLLENQIVSGIPPVYTAKQNNVKLVRAVSKMRFVFSKSSSNPPVISDLSVSLNANMLPDEEYIFLEGTYPDKKSHVKTEAYNTAAVTLVSGKSIADINACDNPATYVYTSGTGQAYETKIDNGLTDIPEGKEKPELSQLGLFYLRESDKKLEGTISYKVGAGDSPQQKNVSFAMNAAGDFTRNHTWIVYGYFLGSGELKLNVVDIKDWTSGDENPKVYNW